MFYYLIAPVLVYNWILILAAIIPAIFLMVRVYRLDRLEAESPAMLWTMVTGGIWSALLALVIERVASAILGFCVPQDDPAYGVILYFVIVGFAEEGAKYYFLHKRSWYSVEFNCQYDGIVYAVFTSLGFALWENISYVLHYGFSTALIRAITAIPGHACFGVFMGVFYGLARGHAYLGENGRSKFCRVLCVAVPAMIHGAYDYVASMENEGGSYFFIAFIIALFVISFLLITRMSDNDRYFAMDRRNYRFWDG